MKELSIKEKARRYDEALEQAKKIYIYCCDDEEQLRKLESIFPEIKESEDEKIKKWLEEHIEAMPDNSVEFKDVKRIDVLHWLEKQGENLRFRYGFFRFFFGFLRILPVKQAEKIRKTPEGHAENSQ